MAGSETQLVLFAWSRFLDPYAIIIAVGVGLLSRAWWQTVLGGLAGGLAMAFVFAMIGGMSSDAPLYFLVDAAVAASWSSVVFFLRGVLRERRRLKQSEDVIDAEHPAAAIAPVGSAESSLG